MWMTPNMLKNTDEKWLKDRKTQTEKRHRDRKIVAHTDRHKVAVDTEMSHQENFECLNICWPGFSLDPSRQQC